MSHLRKLIIRSKYHQQENKFTNLWYIYTMKYRAMKVNYIELHSSTWINHVSLLIKIKTIMFLTLIWWNSESLLFHIFLLFPSVSLWHFHYSYLSHRPWILYDVLFCFVFSFQYFFSLPFHSGSFYGDILNSEISSSAMSNLLISPSKVLFISSIVFFISSFSFQFFIKVFTSLLTSPIFFCILSTWFIRGLTY